MSFARPHAFVDKTTTILARLGYRIIDGEELERNAAEHERAGLRPELMIVEESRLESVTASDRSGLPIIVLTGRDGLRESQPRVVGVIHRPAGLHDLYRLLQQVFEDTPRSTPRVATSLEVRCERAGRSWTGSMRSLSENGCLIRSGESPPLGGCFDLSFELPTSVPLRLRAEAAYQLLPDLGVVFSGIAPSARNAIGHFVSETLLGA